MHVITAGLNGLVVFPHADTIRGVIMRFDKVLIEWGLEWASNEVSIQRIYNGVLTSSTG